MAGSIYTRKHRSPHWQKLGWKWRGKGHHVTSRSPKQVKEGK